jgi:hypothetical protein
LNIRSLSRDGCVHYDSAVTARFAGGFSVYRLRSVTNLNAKCRRYSISLSLVKTRPVIVEPMLNVITQVPTKESMASRGEGL